MPGIPVLIKKKKKKIHYYQWIYTSATKPNQPIK